jgi:hypothetical protein
MCGEIFDRLGLDVQPIENALRISGRGLTYLFPTSDKAIASKALDPPRVRRPATAKSNRKVRRPKQDSGDPGFVGQWTEAIKKI